MPNASAFSTALIPKRSCTLSNGLNVAAKTAISQAIIIDDLNRSNHLGLKATSYPLPRFIHVISPTAGGLTIFQNVEDRNCDGDARSEQRRTPV